MSDIMIQIAERVAKGMPTSYTKADFYRELDERAQRERRPGETREQAFARYAMDDPRGRTLFAAHKRASGPDYRAPVTKVVEPAASPSLVALNKLAQAYREEHPELTSDQAFARTYGDPRNRELVRKERAENRPNLTVEVEKDGDRSVIGQRVTRLAAALEQQHPRMTHDECVDAVLRSNPDLRRAWEREQAA